MTSTRTLSHIFVHYGLDEQLRTGVNGIPPNTGGQQRLYGLAFAAFIGAMRRSQYAKPLLDGWFERFYADAVWPEVLLSQKVKRKLEMREAQAQKSAKKKLANIAKNRPKQRAPGAVKKK